MARGLPDVPYRRDTRHAGHRLGRRDPRHHAAVRPRSGGRPHRARGGHAHAAGAHHARRGRRCPARPAAERQFAAVPEPRASPISAETLRRTRQAFPGAELLHVYGTTETTPITTLLPHEERILDTPRAASCGQPAVGVDVRVIDAGGAEVPPAVVGEIIVRSPSVMTGYGQKPEETAAVLAGDWYRTGDLGYQHA